MRRERPLGQKIIGKKVPLKEEYCFGTKNRSRRTLRQIQKTAAKDVQLKSEGKAIKW
jgi:hypothetical protein